MKVLIVEDSALISAQIIRILKAEPRIKVLGVATEEEVALQMVLELQPDVLLLDLSLSPGSGLGVLRRMRAVGARAQVLVLTNNTEDLIQRECERLGVTGFYDKTEAADACFAKLYSLLPAAVGQAVPPSESRALQQGTAGAEDFHAIAQLARDITGASIGMVSIHERQRQWFLSHSNLLPASDGGSISPEALAVQAQTGADLADRLQHIDLDGSPIAHAATDIRFYAGVPIVVTSGEMVGTLCVLDTEERTLNDVQTQALKTLAHSVVTEIELRKKVLNLQHEVERRRVAENRILEIANQDVLTKLPNRLALQDRLGQQLRQATRQSSQFAFLFLDLDRFKLINDTLGHGAGDAALMEVAARLTRTLREVDTVARIGGDEFAVVLGDINSHDDALHMAAKLNAVLKERTVLEGTSLHFDGSIGIAMFPGHGTTIHDLMRCADIAMYQAKQGGGGAAVMYTEALARANANLLSLEEELERALDQGEIVAHYQPQLLPDGTELVGLEALARWAHPQLGLLGPDKFIAFAESRRVIHRIGQRMLHLVLAQLALWDAQNIYVPRVAVNFSAQEFRDGLVEEIEAALQQHQIEPQRLEIEITESMLLPDNVHVIAMLKHLRRLGVRISVDDFGSGYSSLGQLRRLPIDTLKIDRSFVAELDTNSADRTIVRAIVKMARGLGLQTVAEGVESISQLELLKRLGCDCVQGYVYAKPLRPEDVPAWVQKTQHAETAPAPLGVL